MLRTASRAVLLLCLASTAGLAQLPAANAGASVFVIDSAEIAASNARTLSELLAARVPGLSVMRGGGSAAEGASIRMRGVHSFVLPSTPVLVVDGIRVSSRQATSAIRSTVESSEIDELLPEDIARVEVLRGPAAAASYGPGAADGVIVVTTKSGAPGALAARARTSAGMGFDRASWPANYHLNGVSPTTGQPVYWCAVMAVAEGTCKPTGLDRFDPLVQASPFRVERTAAAHVEMSGGRGGTGAWLGASAEGTQAVLSADDLHRIGARAHLTQRLPGGLAVEVMGDVLRDRALVPNLAAVIGAGLLGGAQNDSTHGYLPPFAPPAHPEDRRADRLTGNLTLHWRPVAWLEASAVDGHDRVSGNEMVPLPYLISVGSSRDTAFGARKGLRHDDVWTLGATVAARYRLYRGLAARTTVAWDRYTYAASTSDSAGYGPSFTLALASHGLRTSGLSLEQQLVWRDRLTLEAGVWRGGPASFGGLGHTELYPTAGAAWSVGDIGPAREVHLRAAFGEAASLDPDHPVASILASPAIDSGANARAERTRETEGGIDLSLGDRVDASLTAFRADSRNLLVPIPFVVSSTPGQLRNSGVELWTRARLLERGPVRWSLTATVATLRNRVVSIGNTDRIGSVIVAMSPYQTRVFAVGHPIANWWMTPYTYADANGDGMIDTSEVHFAKAPTLVGSMSPAVEGSLRSGLELAHGLSAALALDYRGQYRLLNGNEAGRCLHQNCRGLQDPTAPLAEQAAAVANWMNSQAAAFVQDASFLRLRELSVGWQLPARWARFTGEATRVSLVGLDLATFTRYKGVDPEITAGGPNTLPRFDYQKLPILPTVLLRVDLGGSADH